MARPLAKSPFVLLALGLLVLAYLASLAEDDDLNALNRQVNQLIEREKYQEAIPIAERALAVAKRVRGPEQYETADALNSLGFLFQKIGDYAKAEPLYREALRIRQKVLGSEHPDTAKSLNGLASLYYITGEYTKAEPLYREALRIRQKVFGSEYPDTAKSLNNLALLEFDLGRIDEATALARQAAAAELIILSKIFSFTSEEQRLAYLDVFYPYSLFPMLKGTETDLATAVLRYKGVVLDSIIEDRLLAEAGQRSQEQNSPEQLILDKKQLDQLLLQSSQKIPAETNQRIEALKAEIKKIQFDLVENWVQEGSEGSKVQNSLEQLNLDERQLDQLLLQSSQKIPVETNQRIEALEAEIKKIENHLLENVWDKAGSQGSQVQKPLKQLILDKRQLDQLLLQPAQKLSAKANQRIETLEAEVEKIESQLAQQVAGLGQTRHALSVSLEQVQSNIPNDGALIEYLRYEHYLGKGQWEQRYGAIVLFSKGAPLWIPLGKANEIEHLVRRYGDLVRGSPEEEELSANLQALYQALWAPIGQALPGQTKRIIISPDGELNFISFATLLTKDEQFLAQRYSVQYVASGRDLLRELKPSTVKKVVLFANPDYRHASTAMLAKAEDGSSDADSIRGGARGDVEDWRFDSESVENTQKERDELIKKFARWGWTSTDFTAKEATKEALLKIHSPYILHLATHGFFAKEDPSATRTEPESSSNDRQSVTKSKFFKNPMHRSVLGLAGAQTTIEAWKRGEVPPVENDGILTAEDVSTLDLQGTWLVPLSACNTGSGEARAGEGVMGLRRGFIQAGAQNLLMTLWPISDEVTVQIMSDFYEAAHNTGNAPEALAEVQCEWLLKLRAEKGLTQAVNLAGPFIMSSQGKP
jgi:CHAT domain-containing protein